MTTGKRNALWLVGLGGSAAVLFLAAFARSLHGQPVQSGGTIASLVCLLVAILFGKLAHTMVQLAALERELARPRERDEPPLPGIATLQTSHRLRELEALEEREAAVPERLRESA